MDNKERLQIGKSHCFPYAILVPLEVEEIDRRVTSSADLPGVIVQS